jgi:HAD superfamily hydrolase (TIGR01458 family)
MPAAFLLDLDGTLYTDAGPVPGGPEALASLRARGIPFRCVTNTTSRSRTGLVERLTGYGYRIVENEIITPVRAAVELCRSRGWGRASALVPDGALPDLEGLELAAGTERVDAVIVGDLGERWSFGLLQQAFTQVLAGAELVALSRDRYFQKAGVLTLDAGPFVAALEYAAGRTATVVGKPSAEFYRAALATFPPGVGNTPGAVVMAGDDLWSDIEGARRAGLSAWLVRTGKFREEKLRESGIVPDRVIGSVAELGTSEE